MGGQLPNPDYHTVCSGRSGYVEVVRVTFDPAVASYRDILEVFFAIHDPTSLDRQGNDAGSQYRSVIFYSDEGQRASAQEIIRELDAEGGLPRPIVTEVRPATTFYMAEDYHQEYFRQNPQQPYCAFVVSPKVQKFRKRFAARLRRSGEPRA
jgi:peptide-methionine (S)-S-oxide reductase